MLISNSDIASWAKKDCVGRSRMGCMESVVGLSKQQKRQCPFVWNSLPMREWPGCWQEHWNLWPKLPYTSYVHIKNPNLRIPATKMANQLPLLWCWRLQAACDYFPLLRERAYDREHQPVKMNWCKCIVLYYTLFSCESDCHGSASPGWIFAECPHLNYSDQQDWQ